MSKFNSTVVIDTSCLAKIFEDPEAGAKIAKAIQATMFGGDTTVKYDGVVAVTAVESHLQDQVRLIAVGGGTGRDVGAAGPASNLAEGSERALFEAATEKFGLVVRTKAERYGKRPDGEDAEDSAPTPAAS